jgi:hypothetical protein
MGGGMGGGQPPRQQQAQQAHQPQQTQQPGGGGNGVQALLALGFDAVNAGKALKRENGDVSKAAELLLSNGGVRSHSISLFSPDLCVVFQISSIRQVCAQ